MISRFSFFSTALPSELRDFFRKCDKLTLCVFLFFIVFTISGHGGMRRFQDDLLFASMNMPLWDFLKSRYELWSSRVFIEAVLFVFTRVPLDIFKVLNALMLLALPFLLARLSTPHKDIRPLLLPAICLILMYPHADMHTAGWQATCINYFWPLMAALAAALPVKKALEGGIVRLPEQIWGAFCLLFACNNELLCLILLTLIVLCSLHLYRACPRLFLIYAGLAAGSLLFILTCPGNFGRLNEEIGRWMPQFVQLSLVEKLFKCYLTIIVPFFIQVNFIWLSVASLLCLSLFRQSNDIFFRALALSLFAGILTVGPTAFSPLEFLPFTNIQQYIYAFVASCVLAALFPCILLTVSNIRTAMIAFSIPAIAFASRMSMAFSPTLYASNSRSLLYVYAAFLILVLFLYARLFSELPDSTRKLFRLLLIFFSVTALLVC